MKLSAGEGRVVGSVRIGHQYSLRRIVCRSLPKDPQLHWHKQNQGHRGQLGKKREHSCVCSQTVTPQALFPYSLGLEASCPGDSEARNAYRKPPQLQWLREDGAMWVHVCDLCEREQTWGRRKRSKGQAFHEAVFSSPLCLHLQGWESNQGHLWLQW